MITRFCSQRIILPDSIMAGYVYVQDGKITAVTTPAEILGLAKGRIEVGRDADLIVFDDNINIQAVYLGGKSAQ